MVEQRGQRGSERRPSSGPLSVEKCKCCNRPVNPGKNRDRPVSLAFDESEQDLTASWVADLIWQA